jgi:hypothetical protein
MLAWPGSEVIIKSMRRGSPVHGEAISRISLLGRPGELPWVQDELGLKVQLPLQPPGPYACVLKIHSAEFIPQA